MHSPSQDDFKAKQKADKAAAKAMAAGLKDGKPLGAGVSSGSLRKLTVIDAGSCLIHLTFFVGIKKSGKK